MTTADAPAVQNEDSQTRSPVNWLAGTDEWMSTASEWLNPILVKEARQALKSKQFVITFFVMLACGWLWSIALIVYAMPDVYYMVDGPFLLWGYFVILGFPIIIVVPFSVFRSLATELEDGTLELVSTSSLGARQIVTGKLATAVLQTLVYFSGLAPFISFTYFLNGVGISTIALMLISTFVFSVILSAFGTLVATLTRSRAWQTLLSVAMVIVLTGLFGSYWGMCGAMIYENVLERAVSEEPFAWISSMLFTQLAGIVLLFVVAATSRLQFPSENRSTPLRWVMLFQTALYIYWAGFSMIAIGRDYTDGYGRSDLYIMIAIFATIAGIYWAIMAALIQGEYPQISLRTARSLPANPVSRALLTWLGPGPGKGYVFATTVMLVICMLGLASIYVTEWLSQGTTGYYSVEQATCYLILLWSYFASYLIVLRILMMGLRRVANVSVLTSLLVGVLVFFAIHAVSTAAHFLFDGREPDNASDYTIWLLPNLFISLFVAGNDNMFDVNFLIPYFGAIPYAMILVPAAGVGSYFLGLLSSAGEVAQRHIVAPDRVLADDFAKRKERARPSNPWDEDAELPPPPTAVDVMNLLQNEQARHSNEPNNQTPETKPSE